MTKEERDWLESAMKAQRFDDTGMMKKEIEAIKSHREDIEAGG